MAYKLPLRVLVHAKQRQAQGHTRADVAREILREMRLAKEAKPSLTLPLLDEPECEQFFVVMAQIRIGHINHALRDAAKRRKQRQADAAARRTYFRKYQRNRRANPAYRDYANMQRRAHRETLKQESPAAYQALCENERKRTKQWREANPEKYREQNTEKRRIYRARIMADPVKSAAYRERERQRARAYRARKRRLRDSNRRRRTE